VKTVAARMSTKYQIVIPKSVRQVLHLAPRDTLLFLVDGDTVVLRARPASFTHALEGLHREVWDDPDAWLERERASWET
jgi:AbrB family looped-hinge helix DNA binding protein